LEGRTPILQKRQLRGRLEEGGGTDQVQAGSQGNFAGSSRVSVHRGKHEWAGGETDTKLILLSHSLEKGKGGNGVE